MIFFLMSDRLRNDVNTANYSTHVHILDDEQSMTAHEYSRMSYDHFWSGPSFSIPNDHYDCDTSDIGIDNVHEFQ